MLAALRREWLARRLARGPGGSVCVLTYHGVVPRISDVRLERNLHAADVFRSQVRLLSRFRVVSLSEIEGYLGAGAFPSRGATVAITFDDGYENNLEAAAILAESRLPWTIFLSTKAVDRRGTIWTGELSLLLLHGRAYEVTLLGDRWVLDSRSRREAAFQAIRHALKPLPAPERQREMAALRDQMPDGELERLLEIYPGLRSLSWSGVSELVTAGVEIGSHGVEHELHHARQPESFRRAELVDSKREIEMRIGRACRYFSFPDGVVIDESSAEATRAGYKLAFTTKVGAVRPGFDPLTLPRVEPSGTARGLIHRLRDADAAAPRM